MNFIANSRKPKLSALPLLCDFRTSKAYLWGLVRDKLNQIVNKSNVALTVFDAACNSLITREMFNPKLHYYGNDISRSSFQVLFPSRGQQISFFMEILLNHLVLPVVLTLLSVAILFLIYLTHSKSLHLSN